MSVNEINYARSFKCTKCQATGFEEIMENVVVCSLVNHIGDGGYVDYGEQINEDGVVLHYQCSQCGFPIHAEDGSIPTEGEGLRDALKFQAENAA